MDQLFADVRDVHLERAAWPPMVRETPPNPQRLTARSGGTRAGVRGGFVRPLGRAFLIAL
jgi:hypothetical protein